MVHASTNVTATAGTDYTSASGSLTFNAGDTSKTVAITIAADSLDEVNETATFTLSNAVNASIGDSTATLTINDDDDEPSLSINFITVAESAGTGSLTVSMNAASGKDVSFSYATIDGTATAGSDYTATSGTYTISAGDTTQAIPVTITDDTSAESATAETISVTISSITNATMSSTVGTISITDNDGLNKDIDDRLTYNATNAETRRTLTAFTNLQLDWSSGVFASYLSAQNPYEVINAHKAAGYGLSGNGVLVSIVDTEFDTDHGLLNDSERITAYNTVKNTKYRSHGTSVAA